MMIRSDEAGRIRLRDCIGRDAFCKIVTTPCNIAGSLNVSRCSTPDPLLCRSGLFPVHGLLAACLDMLRSEPDQLEQLFYTVAS